VSVVARILAIVAALVGTVVGLAALVRAAALAGDGQVVWPLPRWWTDLTGGADAWLTGLVAAAVAVAAVAYILLAVRQLSPPREPQTVAAGGARVKVAALERLVATRLDVELPGLHVREARVSWSDAGWDVWVLADVPARDLTGVRARAASVAGPELARAAGGSLRRLDVEVRRFVGAS
jgi:hypothetical protein